MNSNKFGLSVFLSFALTLVSLSVFASDDTHIQSMDVEEMEAIQKDGSLVFMSSNGRYLFQGVVTDVWQKKNLKTIDDVRFAESHIDLKNIALDVNKLNTISFGSGKSQVVAYVDPRCPYCKKFVTDAQKHIDKYTFKLVVVPALGDESQKKAKALFCAKDKTKALDYFLNDQLDKLEQQKNCDTANYDLTLLSAKMFKIKSVPWFIAPDGRFKSNTPDAVWPWLETK